MLAPDRPWHETNGPYFGRPDPEEMIAFADLCQQYAGADPEEFTSPRDHALPIVLNETGKVIGTVSWYWEDKRTDWRRLGVVVMDETLWGKGIGTEALQLYTGYMFRETDALHLDLATYSGNHGMIEAARKAGYQEEARIRRARRWKDGVHDAVVMGIIREEWVEAAS